MASLTDILQKYVNTDYDTLVEVAHETGYIQKSEIEVLKEWRFSPSTWGRDE